MISQQKRTSSFELLRIIAMFLIVVSHYNAHGVQPWTLGIENPVYTSLSIGGTLGVNCFVLITGYFMINSSVNFNKIARLLYQVLSFTALISTIAYCVNKQHFEQNPKWFIKSAIGILGNYWFINTYLVMILLTPFVNKMLKSMNHREHCLCIITLISLNYVAPIFRLPTHFGPVGQFLTLYSLAAYIKIYGFPWRYSPLKLTFLTLLLLAGDILIICLFQQHKLFSALITRLIIGHGAVYLLLISTLIFIIFTKIHINYSLGINYIAGCTLGIYIFHEHGLMRNFLWKKMLHCDLAPFSDSPYLHCMTAILIVFSLSLVIDIIYRHTLGYLYKPLYLYILAPVYSATKRILSTLYYKIQSIK